MPEPLQKAGDGSGSVEAFHCHAIGMVQQHSASMKTEAQCRRAARAGLRSPGNMDADKYRAKISQ